MKVRTKINTHGLGHKNKTLLQDQVYIMKNIFAIYKQD
jgi:hypothetical protein